jgi:hypothetical protein
MNLTFDGLLSDDGGFADVYEAHDDIGRRLAVKIVRDSSVGISDALAHAKALVRAAHKNIVTVHAVEKVSDPKSGEMVDAIVMEYLEGETLDVILSRGNLSETEVVHISIGVIKAIRHVHGLGMVHGDLHEKNIMVVGGNAKVIDLLYRYTLLSVDAAKRESLVEREIHALGALITSMATRSSFGPTEISSFLNSARRARTLDNLEAAIWRLQGAPEVSTPMVDSAPIEPMQPINAAAASEASIARVPLQPAAGKARFRPEGEAIGSLFNRLPGPNAKYSPDLFLADGPAMWLRLIPVNGLDHPLGGLSIDKAIQQTTFLATPLNQEEGIDIRKVRAADGMGICTVYGGGASAVFFCFDNGEIWTIDASLRGFNDQRVYFNERSFGDALLRGIRVLDELAVQPPYRWEAGVEGISNYEFAPMGRAAWAGRFHFAANVVSLGGLVRGSLTNQAEALQVLEPFFGAVFDAAHMER